MKIKHIPADEKIALKLTSKEAEAILTDVMCLDQTYVNLLRQVPGGKPVMMTLDDVDEFAGYVAAEANHTDDKRLGRILDRVFDKCQRLLETYSDEPVDPVRANQAGHSPKPKLDDSQSDFKPETPSSQQNSQSAQSAKFPIKMTQHQRDSLLRFTDLESAVEQRIELAGKGTQVIELTKTELDHLQDETTLVVHDARSPHKQRLAAIQKKIDSVLEAIDQQEPGYVSPNPKKGFEAKSDCVIQLKVSLLSCRPTIWRRIQIEDCTLEELHRHLQSAMGWEDCHMHEFTVDGKSFGMAMEDDFGFAFERETHDESNFRLSELVPQNGKRLRFQYVYDMGDDWRHEIVFEGYRAIDRSKRYPICVEGERACPPEDIGGPWGFANYLDAVNDPNHENHEDTIGWMGDFDEDSFSVDQATRKMRAEQPDA